MAACEVADKSVCPARVPEGSVLCPIKFGNARWAPSAEAFFRKIGIRSTSSRGVAEEVARRQRTTPVCPARVSGESVLCPIKFENAREASSDDGFSRKIGIQSAISRDVAGEWPPKAGPS
jgi:hypothetical protein